MADKQENIGAKEPTGDKGGAGKLIAVIVVVTILAILLVPGEQSSEPDVSPSTTGSTQDQTESPSLLTAPSSIDLGETIPKSEASTDEPDSASAPPPGPGEAARNLIRELRASPPIDLERAYAAGREFETQNRPDDAYLMFFFAAREGHGTAAMRLAREADPASFREGGLLDAPDALQANKWYEKARQADEPGASEALQQLRARVEEKARSGDARARRIMLQWK